MAIIKSCCFWKSLRKGCFASALYTFVSFHAKNNNNKLSSMDTSAFATHECVNNTMETENTADDTLQQHQLCIPFVCVFADLFCHIMHFHDPLPLRRAGLFVGKGWQAHKQNVSRDLVMWVLKIREIYRNGCFVLFEVLINSVLLRQQMCTSVWPRSAVDYSGHSRRF